MSRRTSNSPPSPARIAFLNELVRLLEEFPNRWSRSTLRIAVTLAEVHRAPSVSDLLDRIQRALRPPTPPAA